MRSICCSPDPAVCLTPALSQPPRPALSVGTVPIPAVCLGSCPLLLFQQGKLLLGRLGLLPGLAEGQRGLGMEGWQKMFIPHPRQSHGAQGAAEGNKEEEIQAQCAEEGMETSRMVPQSGWRGAAGVPGRFWCAHRAWPGVRGWKSRSHPAAPRQERAPRGRGAFQLAPAAPRQFSMKMLRVNTPAQPLPARRPCRDIQRLTNLGGLLAPQQGTTRIAPESEQEEHSHVQNDHFCSVNVGQILTPGHCKSSPSLLNAQGYLDKQMLSHEYSYFNTSPA